MSKKLGNPQVLAFERKLVNSDALMFAGKWQNRENKDSWKPINLREKAVRGTISNRLKTKIANDPAKLDAEVEKPNLQRVDVAALPFDSDTLKVQFSLRVLGGLDRPSACDNPAYQSALSEKIGLYQQEYQFKELASRYAENIANGRFLWRNRVGSEAVEVHVTHANHGSSTTWIFNAYDYSLRSFSERKDDLAQLAEVIRKGLNEEQLPFLEIEAYTKLGHGQEVFPSEELVLDNSSTSKGKKSKFLYQVQYQEDNCIAAMHSQKIGNALRTIDDWYPEAFELGPIAVEPYGSVTNRGVAYRKPTEKVDFYTLLDNWILKDKTPSAENQHYVIACLIRGGVFGESNKE